MSFIPRALTWLSDRIPLAYKWPNAVIPREIPNIQLPVQEEYNISHSCTLHALCSSCRNVFSASSHIKGTSFLSSAWTERFTLWHSLEDLESSVRSRCHFCTIVWQVIGKNEDGQPRTEVEISELGISKVVLEISKPKDNIEISISNLEKSHVGHIRVTSQDGRALLPTNTCHPAQNCFSTSSKEHERLAGYWFQECSTKHALCKGPGSAFMPTRLIQIDENGLIKVVDCADLAERISYCTLSHSWGGATDILTLTSKNTDELSSPFSLQRLLKSFQDAIEITQWLGHRYLWIDCLCIVQDSKSDWASEASRMASVYEQSSCTIASMTGTTPHHGCFERRDPLTFSPCRIATSNGGALFAQAVDRPLGDIHKVSKQYLNTRAWVLQERIFSPRLLCFTSTGIFWSCRAGCATERDQDGWGHSEDDIKEIFGPAVTYVDWISRVNNIQDDNFEDLLSYRHPTDARSYQAFSISWFKVVTAYSARNLTVSADKLIAISSIANRVKEKTGFRYLAGLWMETLHADLLWSVDDQHTRDRPKSYRAPSWSWASVDGIIHWQGDYQSDVHIESMVKIVDLDLQLHPEDKNGAGILRDGILVLEGCLKKPSSITKPKEQHVKLKGSRHIVLDEPRDDEKGYNVLDLDYNLTAEQESDLHLLPVRRLAVQDSNHRADPYNQCTQGLAVLKCNDSNVYERAGLFTIVSRKPRFVAAKWFSDATLQTIAIK